MADAPWFPRFGTETDDTVAASVRQSFGVSPARPGVGQTRSKPGKTQNQDYAQPYHGSRLSAVLVADGVGSAVDAHLASRCVVEEFVDGLDRFDRSGQPLERLAAEVKAIWTGLTGALNQLRAGRPQSYSDLAGQHILETTLLSAIDTGDRYLVSYVGNGSVFYVRGDFHTFPKTRWPWPIVNLVAGQSVCHPVTGKDELRHALAPAVEPPPVVFVEHSKDREHGDLLIVCSDGVSSEEQLRTGYDASNKLWIEINPHVRSLIEQRLSPYVASLPARQDAAERIGGLLDAFLTGEDFEDDASVGVLIADSMFEASASGRRRSP